MKSSTRTIIDINSIYFLSGVGKYYYALVLPAMSLIFSQDLQQLKITFSLFFLIMAMMQFFPQILTQHVGLKRAVMIYLIVFIAGTIAGCFYQGSFWIIALSRSLQAFGLSALPLISKVLAYQHPKKMKSLIFSRKVLKGFSGPLIVLICGFILHYSSWLMCYIFICLIYGVGLLWFIFSLKGLELKQRQGEIKSIKHQLLGIVNIFKHDTVLYLLAAGGFIIAIGDFIYSIYAFILIHDFHVGIRYISTVPMFFYAIGLMGSFLSHKVIKISKSLSMLLSLLVMIFLALCFFLFATTIGLTSTSSLVFWLVLIFFCGLVYVIANSLLAYYAHQFDVVIEANTLYFFIKNMLPLLMFTLWTYFSDVQQVAGATEIILFSCVASGLCYLFFLRCHRQEKRQ